jgi:hypothetical protein
VTANLNTDLFEEIRIFAEGKHYAAATFLRVSFGIAARRHFSIAKTPGKE